MIDLYADERGGSVNTDLDVTSVWTLKCAFSPSHSKGRVRSTSALYPDTHFGIFNSCVGWDKFLTIVYNGFLWRLNASDGGPPTHARTSSHCCGQTPHGPHSHSATPCSELLGAKKSPALFTVNESRWCLNLPAISQQKNPFSSSLTYRRIVLLSTKWQRL